MRENTAWTEIMAWEGRERDEGNRRRSLRQIQSKREKDEGRRKRCKVGRKQKWMMGKVGRG